MYVVKLYRHFVNGVELLMKNLVLSIKDHKKKSCLYIFNIFKLMSKTYENFV